MKKLLCVVGLMTIVSVFSYADFAYNGICLGKLDDYGKGIVSEIMLGAYDTNLKRSGGPYEKFADKLWVYIMQYVGEVWGDWPNVKQNKMTYMGLVYSDATDDDYIWVASYDAKDETWFYYLLEYD